RARQPSWGRREPAEPALQQWCSENNVPPRNAKEAGSAMLELALILPMLVVLSLGTADFARLVTLKIAVQDAAYAGANFVSERALRGSGCPPDVDLAGVESAAVNSFAGRAAGFAAEAAVACAGTTGGTLTDAASCDCSSEIGTFVRVRVSAPFRTLGSYPWLPSPVRVSASSVVRVR
ncbi:MAG: TadE/TadG family type IV pilus assembly protein, partial [Bryobacteraceae bacterium]